MRKVHGAWPSTVSGILARLFNQARTFSYWQKQPVPETLVEAAFELASLSPTSANCEPLRLVLVRSPQAKERLLSCASSGNYEKVRTAPITAIVAYDREFFELLPRLYPHTGARGWLTTNPALAEETALRNSSLQGAYSYWRCVPSSSRRTMAYELSVEHRLWRPRPAAPQTAATRL
jgi:3-hydroxypropanoate dehydrogenase